jgi:hypothetical protein
MDELALRDWVRPRLDAATRQEMATYDYGMRVDEHRHGIDDLLAVGRLPEVLDWIPGEVLQLTCYDPPSQEARLFACLVLVRARNSANPVEALVGLVDAAINLGATAEALRYLRWLRGQNLELGTFLTLALLLLDPDPALMDEFTAAAEQYPPVLERKNVGAAAWRICKRLLGRAGPPAEQLLEWF